MDELDKVLNSITSEEDVDYKYTITICFGRACKGQGAVLMLSEAEMYLLKEESSAEIKLESSLCMGNCKQAPNIRITNNETGNTEVKGNLSATEIVKYIKNKGFKTV